MRSIESPQWSQRDRERSPRPKKLLEFPILDGIKRVGNVIDVKPFIDISKIKNPRDRIGRLYEEEYIRHLIENPNPQGIILTSRVIDSYFGGFRGAGGLPDMLRFIIEEIQGGDLKYTLVEEGEARSSELDRTNKLKMNGKLLRQATSRDLFVPLLKSVGENPEIVSIPKDRRNIQFTFVSPRQQQIDLFIRDVPKFRLNYLQLPLPEIY